MDFLVRRAAEALNGASLRAMRSGSLMTSTYPSSVLPVLTGVTMTGGARGGR
jgi:hypothetical protein